MKIELSKFNEPNQYYSYDDILFTRTISVNYFITPERIVFCLHVPILETSPYNLYHLYSIPTPAQTTIIPPTSYVAMTEDGIYYLRNICQEIQGEYFCHHDVVKRNYQQDTCIRNLLRVHTPPSCTPVPVEIKETLVETIGDGRYLLISPAEIRLHEKCGNEEVHRLQGVYLITVPYSCKFIAESFEYTNENMVLKSEPVYLPPIPMATNKNIKPIQLDLKSFDLDELSKLTLQHDEEGPLAYINSQTLWTHSNLSIYLILITIFLIVVIWKYRTDFKTRCQRRRNHRQQKETTTNTLEMREAFPTPAKRSPDDNH